MDALLLRTVRNISICLRSYCVQERLQVIMSAQFAKQEAALTSKVAELEAKAAANGVT